MKNKKSITKFVEKETLSDRHLYEAVNLGGQTPILQWYTTNFGLPDIHRLGTHNIEEIVKEYKDKSFCSIKNIHSKKDTFTPYVKEMNFLLDDTGIVMNIYEGGLLDENNKPIGDIKIFYKSKQHNIDKLILSLRKHIYKKDGKSNLSIVCRNQNGLYTQEFKIKEPIIDFKLNYNADFKAISDLIIEKLSVENSKGIVMLQGTPGTGKTTFVRHLINRLSKQIVYVPPDMAHELSSPHFIPFLMGIPNCILIIEDAENILMKREEGCNNQAVSNLLNITDGLLSDCLNIQVVCTANFPLSGIDSALLRKGRLIAKYEFKELTEDRARLLAKKLNVQLSSKATLAEIYNSLEMGFTDKRTPVGFNIEEN